MNRESNILILAPLGNDAKIAADVLSKAGLMPEIIQNFSALCQRVSDPAGVIILTEEAIAGEDATVLKGKLSTQEPWSDIPIILMTGLRQMKSASRTILEFLSPSGNISILERPFHTFTLISATEVALRARRKQYQVKELLSAQRAAVEQRDEFVSIASHELKTPITSLKLQLQMARLKLRNSNEKSVPTEPMIKLFTTCTNQVDRMTELIEDMLDVSRITAGKLSFNFEEFNLSDLVLEVAEAYQDSLTLAECKLNLQLDGGIIVTWDKFRIEQVIVNLLTNALKYAPGEIISIKTQMRDKKVRLTVEDTGGGIPSEKQEFIFERFERGVSSRNTSGLGLGLFIVRQIVLAHHGTVHVESLSGRGAKFIVEIPPAL